MTTLAQIEKIAGRWFADQMRRRGFAVEKKCRFWRKRGPLFDLFTGEVLPGGVNFRMNATIWSPWIDHPETGEFSVFPPDFGEIGGELGDRFPEYFSSGALFSVESDAEIEEALKKSLQMIDRHALPWMASVNSCERYLSYVDARSFQGTGEFRKIVKHGIKRGFEREPYL